MSLSWQCDKWKGSGELDPLRVVAMPSMVDDLVLRRFFYLWAVATGVLSCMDEGILLLNVHYCVI